MNLNDSGAGSLRDAIATTPAGGTVDFQAGLSGTITLNTGELLIAKNLTIAGPGADVITVSGNNASRVFDVGATFTVDISGLTIADGSVTGTDHGAGIFNAGALTLTASAVSGNSDEGIWNQGSLMTITGSTISGNSLAGIYNASSTLTVTASTLSANDDGGIVNVSSTLTITSCTFHGNTGSNGGGIFSGIGSTLTVTASTFSGNSVMAGGGGIFNAGIATVTNSTFSGNVASAGGGILNVGLLSAAEATLTNSTLSGNSAANVGGGIYNFGAQATIISRNTILAANTAAGSPDISGVLTSQGHNLIGDGTGGSGYDATDLVGTSSNPIDPLLGPLQDNGGPTFTMTLLPGSPAINAGDPTDAPMWDQRGPGYPRVVNGMIDIGAYEHQAVATTITCSVVDPLLWPPNHRLVNVGLSVDVQPPDATVQVQVYANDNANSSDAADIAPDTLRLRAERQGNASGRVYLIVVTATSGGQTAFDVCAVVVPHDQSPGSIARVQAEAAAAEAYYREFQTAPPGYNLLGQGSTDAGGNGARSLVASIGNGTRLATVAVVSPPTAHSSASTSTIPAADPTGNVITAGTVAPVDRYFALRSEERGGTEADPWLPDLWLSDTLFS
jgi:hypothetical protein